MTLCGVHLHELCNAELLRWLRDIEQAREAVAHDHGEALARGYDDDLEEISNEIRGRSGLSEWPALPPIKPNPWLGKIRIKP